MKDEFVGKCLLAKPYEMAIFGNYFIIEVTNVVFEEKSTLKLGNDLRAIVCGQPASVLWIKWE